MSSIRPISRCRAHSIIRENRAEAHPDIVERIGAIMVEARANSEFNKFWPLPEHRLNQVKPDKIIFDQLGRAPPRSAGR